MPGRLDKLTIALNRGDITLTWDSRQALLARLQHVRDSTSLRAVFEAVGAARPAELTAAQTATLLGLLDQWSTDDASEAMPAELGDLRDALRDHLADLV
jgi:hypothetical protein